MIGNEFDTDEVPLKILQTDPEPTRHLTITPAEQLPKETALTRMWMRCMTRRNIRNNDPSR